MSENVVMNTLQLNIEFTMPVFGGHFSCILPIKIVAAIIVLASFVIDAKLFFTTLPNTTEEFVVRLLLLDELAVFVAYFVTCIIERSESKKVYDTILQLDVEMNVPLASHKDWKLYLMSSSYPVLIGTLAMFLLVRGPRTYDFPFVGIALVSLMILEVAMLKYVIAKRLRYIRSEEEYMDRIGDIVSLTRQLLECNERLNQTYSLIATVCTIYSCQLILQILYASWAVNVAGVNMPFSPMSNPLLEIGFFSAIASIYGLLSACSSFVVFEVGEVKLKLDVTYSTRNCTQTQEKLIYLSLMELHHAPVQLSALGLFNIGLSSLSQACATFMSYLLVFIQYT